MNYIAVLSELIPPRRREITPGTYLPGVIFLIAYAVACVVLSLKEIVLFTNLWAFTLLLTAPWLWWHNLNGYSGLPAGRSQTALLVRMALLFLFVTALAEPRAVRFKDELSVLYCLDLSDSVGDRARDTAMEYIARTVQAQGDNDNAGLVVFGRNSSVELPPLPVFQFIDGNIAINSRINREGTDIAGALRLSAAMVPEGQHGRVVFISDGIATEGGVNSAIEDLKSRNVQVDVLGVDYDFPHEVWLEKLELPAAVKEGETYEAVTILCSLSDGTGVLRLRENGSLIFEQEVSYVAGKNRFNLPIYLRGPGFYEYVATIDPPKGRDGWKENNIAINNLLLKGKQKALVVYDDSGAGARVEDWSFFVKALRESKREVELMSAYRFPRDPMSLMSYDCVCFMNVAADVFDFVQMNALRDAVRNYGTGFLMVGGQNSFGPGGYHRTPVEEALPVSMDVNQRRVMPKGALALVLHTCEFPEGNTWGKRIAKEAIRVLSARDEAGVLAYERGKVGWVFPLQTIDNYEEMCIALNGSNAGDMPSFADAMTLGLNSLRKSDAATKHMIIITDGDPSPPPPNLLAKFIIEKVSVTMVAVKPHGNSDLPMMQKVARMTGGKFYYPKNPSTLPSIFIKEAKTLRRSMVENTLFQPQVEMPSPILKGISSCPPLHGLVLTSPKSNAITVLKKPEDEDTIPLLATWRFGLGKSAAFTSDLTTNWAKDWIGWEGYRSFVSQLVKDLSNAKEDSGLNLQAQSMGSTGIVSIDDYEEGKPLNQISARVIRPDNTESLLDVRQVGPGKYEAEFPLEEQGRYQVVLSGSGSGRHEVAIGGLVVPYSREYLRFTANPLALKKIAEETDGQILKGDEDGKVIFRHDRPPKATSRPIFDWFIIALACLIPLDVGVRRIQIDWAVIRRRFRRQNRGESTVTMSSLLKTKGKVRKSLDREEDGALHGEKHLSPEMERIVIRKADKSDTSDRKATSGKVAKKKKDETARAVDMESTTGRLLAKKRKRKDN